MAPGDGIKPQVLLIASVRSGQMTHPVDIPSIRSTWHSRGFSCDVWNDPSGQVWENYTHAVDELVMVLEGEVEFEISGKILQPVVGEEVFIPAGAVHSVRNKGITTSRWLYGYRCSDR